MQDALDRDPALLDTLQPNTKKEINMVAGIPFLCKLSFAQWFYPMILKCEYVGAAWFVGDLIINGKYANGSNPVETRGRPKNVRIKGPSGATERSLKPEEYVYFL